MRREELKRGEQRQAIKNPKKLPWVSPFFASFALFCFCFGYHFQSEQSPQPNTELQKTELQSPEPTPTVAAVDPATLNLHRWGAVTIFHGLPSDRVNAIAEDAQGLLWFGTDNGLVSYDGRNVEPRAIESLVSRRVDSLKLDTRGNLWIGTDAGAARFRNGRPENLPEARGQTIAGIATSPQNEIALVTSSGEIILCRESAEQESYRESTERMTDSERAASGRLSVTRIDRNSQPLLKSPNRPDQILPLTAVSWAQAARPKSGRPTPGPGPGSGPVDWIIGSSGRGALIQRAGELQEASTRSPRPYFITSIYNDAESGIVWLGEGTTRQQGGLWMYRRGTLTRFPLNTGEVTALHGGGGQLWVGTNRQGAYLINSGGGNPKLIEHLTFENTAGGLRSNHINTIFRNHEGLVWFGTDRGVCRYDRESFRTINVSHNPQSNFVRSLLRTSSGETFCGTNHGLFQPAPETSDDLGTPWSEVAELQGRAIYALYEDDRGAVWTGTSSGLFIRPKDSSTFKHVTTVAETETTITDENQPGEQPFEVQEQPPEPLNPQLRESVRAIAGFRKQIYAAIFERGIERIEVGENGSKRTLVLSNKAAQHAICFAVDGNNALWFGTGEGELWRYDGSQTVSYAPPQKQNDLKTDRAVRAIGISHLGGRQRLWFGTSQALYLHEGDSWRKIIPDIDVRALLVSSDASGRETVWCATQNAGLIKLLPEEGISIRFDTEQGLASQQVFALIPDNSEIWIGTSRGIVRHQPSSAEPRLRINQLVADRIYLPENLTAELSLPHTQGNFLLEVTGVGGRTFPSQFQYEFTLKTADGETPPKRTRDPQLFVENLNPGGYSISARAISRDLVYSAPLTVRLRINKAPFPLSTILLASLLGVAVIAAVWAYRQQRRLARTNRALEETNAELHETRLRLASETEAERSRIARDLHDQTLADLRHLLVLTDQLPAPTGEDSSPSPALLRREIEVISSEVRHICEDLSPSVLENIGFLPAFEWALSDAVSHLAATEKFAYHFNCEPELEDRLMLSHIEKIQLYRIAQEALNNICLHARASQVKMSIRTENGRHLVIEIEDDGVGFGGITTNRTGHGIANIRSRANLIGASVDWSRTEPGCRFKVLKANVVKDKDFKP